MQTIAKLILLLPLAVALAKTPNKENGIVIGNEKQGRVFSLFSIVTFPNEACSFLSGELSGGVCRTASECTSDGGVADGSCAAGFGVCCKIVSTECGITVNKNRTYVKQTNLLASTTSSCKYTVTPMQTDICQIRLDFVAFSLQVGTDGACNVDTFTAKGPTGTTLPTLCGENAGQHMYIENGASTANTELTFTLSTAVTTGRSWNVLITQIQCSSAWRAPTDCLQYYTGASGTISSFNKAGKLMLQSLDYTVCMRQEQGFCRVDFSSSDFSLQQATAVTAATVDANCVDSFLQIPNSGDHTLYCGAYLSTIADDVTSGVVREQSTPFTLGVFTTSGVAVGTGFTLSYNQVPCS